jgi:uncharacterized NAD-dependent epimerase/dehydratase family protein
MTEPRRMVILVDGYTDTSTAKTAICVIRYRTEEVTAVLDRGGAGKTCGQLLGVGGGLPVVAALADAFSAAGPRPNTLLLGIAPPGGKIPAHWRQIVLDALARGMTIVSGLHQFLADDPEFAQAAQRHGGALVDLRRNDEHDVANRVGIRADCLRIHTIANDCSSGKMVASVEIARGLNESGVDAAFVATGQTGILVAGSGCPVDRVISDFVAGAAERLVLANQHHEVIVVEGQGSLFSPRYSGVTLSLLHGTMPHALIACYEMGRTAVFGMPDVPLPSLRRVIDFYELAANIMHPCRVIGVAVNGVKFADAEVAAECARVEDEFQLPACDVIRHGPAKLVKAVRRMKDGAGSVV